MYTSRTHAGRHLANLLSNYREPDALVLAIPRGGVPIACVVAEQLHLPLDVLLVKKIPHPAYPEYAIGAAGPDNYFVENPKLFSKRYVENTVQNIRSVLAESRSKFMAGEQPHELKDKNVIIVDDGMATGHTLLAAVKMVQAAQPAKIIVAVPVASPQALSLLKEEVDEIIVPLVPDNFNAVGNYYSDFSQVSDSEVRGYLDSYRKVYQRNQHIER